MEQIVMNERTIETAIEMLGLEDGDAIHAEPQTRYNCDCAYLTRDGDVIRLMFGRENGWLRISRRVMEWIDIPKAEANAMIVARVSRVKRLGQFEEAA